MTGRTRCAAAVLVGVSGSVAVALSAGRLRRVAGEAGPRWGGLFVTARTPDVRHLATAAFVAGLVLLAVAGWLLLAARPRARTAAAIGAAWSLPLLLAPPAASLDVFSYAAQGDLLERGLDPSHTGVGHAGSAFALAADPRWRGAPAPYGPLALLVSHGAAAAGGRHVLATVLLLRVVAVLSLVAVVGCAVRIAADPVVAVVVAAGPLALVTLVSAAHHEALMTALVVAVLAAHRAGRGTLAYLLAALAVAVKVPGLVALGAVVALDVAEAAGLRDRARVIVRAGAVTAVVWGVLALCVPSAFGWVRALSTPGLGHTPVAPVSVAARVLPGGAHGWRDAGQVAAVLLVAALVLTVRRRALVLTVGWSLLAVGLLGPVLYPWYLAPAAIVLAFAATPAARTVALSASAGGPWLALPRLG
jgi:hypothetical protein